MGVVITCFRALLSALLACCIFQNFGSAIHKRAHVVLQKIRIPILSDTNNPDTIIYNDQPVRVDELLLAYDHLQGEVSNLKKDQKMAVRRYKREEELKPYQAELLRLQQYLEQNRIPNLREYPGKARGLPL